MINDLLVLFTSLSLELDRDALKTFFFTEIITIDLSPEEKLKFIQLLNLLLKYDVTIRESKRRRRKKGNTPVHHPTPHKYYSVTRKKMATADSKKMSRPVPYRPSPSFWDAPVTNLGVKIWEDLVSLGGLVTGLEKDFNFMDNIVANLGTDILIDKSLDVMAEGSKKVSSKLSASLMSKLSVRAGAKAASYFVLASVSRKVVGMAVKVLVKVAVQMLKLLAKLATLAFNVVAMVLTFISILGLILDLAIDTSWMNQLKYKSDLEKYAQSFNESFRSKMNLTDIEAKTAPFSPRDLLNYVVESNNRSGTTPDTINPVTGEPITSYEQLMSEIFNDKPMFSEEENIMYLNHYYQYLGSRTINKYGQPINGHQSIETFDSQAKVNKIRSDLVEIIEKGSVYGRAVGYNARRMVVKNAIDKERAALEGSRLGSLHSATFVLLGSLLLASRRPNSLFSILLVALAVYTHLVCTIQTKEMHIKFINESRLFNFNSEYDDTLSMGATEYKNNLMAIAKFHQRFFFPFNREIRHQYNNSEE